MNIGILGGGLSGVALAHYLKYPTEILEAGDRVGGLCKTFIKDGFSYDAGGHILFSKRKEINDIVDQILVGNLNQCKRNNKILLNGRYLKYPFENDLGSLTKEDNYACLIDFFKKNYPEPKINLKEWAYYYFGRSISEKYFIPYNEKIWNCPAEQLSLKLVERIPRPPLEDIVKSALGIETEGYLHQLYFRYPALGGIEALIKSLLPDKQKIELNYKIKKINRSASGWKVSNQQIEKEFEKIIISFPIHEAIACLNGVPTEVKTAVKNLRFNSIAIVMLAVNNESLLDKSAIYIPDKTVLPHRVCFMGYFSKNLIKPGTSSLIAEITTNSGDGIHELTDDEIIAKVKNDLDRIGVINKNNVIASDITKFKYGYPVYNLDYSHNIKIVKNYFASLNIDLCGRFAEFEYINMDECLKRAIYLSDKLNKEI